MKTNELIICVKQNFKHKISHTGFRDRIDNIYSIHYDEQFSVDRKYLLMRAFVRRHNTNKSVGLQSNFDNSFLFAFLSFFL